MSKILKLSSLLLLSVLLAGCQTTVTNLTPKKATRSTTGMYTVEVAWETTEQVVRLDSVKPFVMIEHESYPMRQTLGTKNRWETVIPVPPTKNNIFYHIRFDYECNSFGKPTKDTKLSPGYKLEIIEP
jgi:hypothetical protein